MKRRKLINEAVWCDDPRRSPEEAARCRENQRPKTSQECIDEYEMEYSMVPSWITPASMPVIKKAYFADGNSRVTGGGSCANAKNAIRWAIANESRIMSTLNALKGRLTGKLRVPSYGGGNLNLPLQESNKSRSQLILEQHRKNRQAHPASRKEWWYEG